MTDLTPFVDEYFGEDEQLNELKVKLKGLKERGKIFMAVEVTGPGRHPIYASGQFDDDGRRSKWKPDLWRVTLSSQAPCRFSDLRNLEIWVCGSKKPGFPLSFIYGQHSPQAVLGMDFGPTVWVNLGWTPEELDERNLNVDRSRVDVMEHVFTTLERADPEKLCEITHVYQPIADSSPVVQSVSRERDVDDLVSVRDTVLKSLRNLGIDEGMRLSLDPIGDMFMNTIKRRGVDVHDEAVLEKFLTDAGAQRIFGERSSHDDYHELRLNTW